MVLAVSLQTYVLAAGGCGGHGFVDSSAQDCCFTFKLTGRRDCHYPHIVGFGFTGLQILGDNSFDDKSTSCLLFDLNGARRGARKLQPSGTS
jgi:hypothetical protein